MQKLTDGILLYHGSYIEIPKIDLNKCTKLTSNAINALEFLGSEPYGR